MVFIDVIEQLYEKSVAESEKNLTFWEEYLKDLKSLDFDVYNRQLKVPILVPIGNKILFKGELQHTNEVTVSLGANYFVKCSIAQAEILKQHRIKDAQSKVDLFKNEKEYLANRISFTKENVFSNNGHEILEEYSEEEDKAWREKHKENLKKYKQSQAKDNIEPKDVVTDAELWERLEELELQEELENELLDNYNEIVDCRKENTFLAKEEALLLNSFKDNKNNHENKIYAMESDLQENAYQSIQVNEAPKLNHNKEIVPNEISKHELLQKVFAKQNILENKLHELKNREKKRSTTEQDLIERLEEIEQLDELEDEMERLDDILETENIETEDSLEDEDKSESEKLKKSISFADENDGETLEITFSHTDAEPDTDPFDPERGITKPSDLYEAYSQLFYSKTTSILKKSNYGTEEDGVKPSVIKTKQVMFEETMQSCESLESEDSPVDTAIVIKDVVEKFGVNQHKIEGGARPTSLFKKKRMQNK